MIEIGILKATINLFKFNEESEAWFTWKHFESMPVEKAAITIANMAIRKPCQKISYSTN